jgi:hypothetical protein
MEEALLDLPSVPSTDAVAVHLPALVSELEDVVFIDPEPFITWRAQRLLHIDL